MAFSRVSCAALAPNRDAVRCRYSIAPRLSWTSWRSRPGWSRRGRFDAPRQTQWTRTQETNQDTRTPEELLELIEAKGREAAEALAVLRGG